MMQKSKKLNVLVLAGGPSEERDVSFQSGHAVAKALQTAGHRVRLADISPDDLTAIENADSIDVVFPALHGSFGEDGQLQKIMDEKKIRFVGSDDDASRLAMDKYRTKKMFEKNRLPTPKAILIEKDTPKEQIENITKNIDMPTVVKPNCQGSSIGVEIIRQKIELAAAIEKNAQKYGDCLVENFVNGRELTVAILGDQALPLIEILPKNDFYDYHAKYIAENTGYQFNTGLDEKLIEKIRVTALNAFYTLGCRDMARVDFMLDEQNRHWLIEVNTIPGFTNHSLLPMAAAKAGINMPELCDQIVRLAHDRPI